MGLKTEFSPAKTYWAVRAEPPFLFPVEVVAESSNCLWLKPDESDGKRRSPILRHKRALTAFDSFDGAKHYAAKLIRGKIEACNTSRGTYELWECDLRSLSPEDCQR